MIGIEDVEVDRRKFKFRAKEKIDAVKKYYKEHGELDKPISVLCHGEKYKLEDKYLRFYVAEELGLKEIAAKISTEKRNKLEDRIRNIGTKVNHIKWGRGRIEKVIDNRVTIRFDSGKEITFDIAMCVEKKLINII